MWCEGYCVVWLCWTKELHSGVLAARWQILSRAVSWSCMWHDRSQVRSHTCHLVLSLSNKWLRTHCNVLEELCCYCPCHLNTTGGLLNVYSMTKSSLCRVWAAVPEAIQTSELTFPFVHIQFTHTAIASPEWQQTGLFFQRAWCPIMHFAAWSSFFLFLSISVPLSLSKLSSSVSSWALAVISFSHASQHWYCFIDYDLNVCFQYGTQEWYKRKEVMIMIAPTPDISLSLVPQIMECV